MKPIKICFISLRSYPLFAKKSNDYFGGAEVQIKLLATELAKDEHFVVSVITGDYGQPSIINQGRLRLFKTKLFDFFKILKIVDADVYVERTVNPKIYLVGWFCKFFRKKFVYMIAHDWDCQPGFNNYLKGFSRFSFQFGLKQADLVVCQTKQQQFKLKKNFRIQATLMRSVIKPSMIVKQLKKDIILWVGRADKWKQPEKFIQLAEKLPKEKFVMICRQGNDKKFYLKVKNLAQKQNNLKFLEVVNYEQIINYFQQAKVFVNTSIAEGFPNTFLQAGLTKTPVLSMKVNPDNYIFKNHCGLIGNQRLKQIINNPKLLRVMGQNHYDYVKKYHSFKNINIFKQVLLEL